MGRSCSVWHYLLVQLRDVGLIAVSAAGVRDGRDGPASVGVVQELDDRHAHRCASRHLLGGAQRIGLVRRHRVDPGLAPGGKHIADVLTHRRPAGHCGRRAVLQVVGMGHHRQGPAPVLRQRTQNGTRLIGILPPVRIGVAHRAHAMPSAGERRSPEDEATTADPGRTANRLLARDRIDGRLVACGGPASTSVLEADQCDHGG